jgi:hypothetical protein
MKRLMILGAFGALLVLGTTGCRIGECWRSAWSPRCCSQQAVVVSDGCCESPCDSCGGGVPVVAAPCSSCGR